MLLELIRTRVASTFRVVEEGRDRLVLQANWLNYLGGATVFFFLGSVLLWMGSTFDNRVSSLSASALGVASSLGGLAAVAIGLSGARRRIVFDRAAQHMRREPNGRVSPEVPFHEIARLQQGVIEGMSDNDSSLVYYRLFLVRTSGEEIEVCLSRDEQLTQELASKIRQVLEKPASRRSPAG